MSGSEIAVFQLYDNETIMDILCITLVGQDLSAFEVQKLASVCKKFNNLLYSPRFFNRAFSIIKGYGGSMAREMLRIGKTKEWCYFRWKKAQGAIVYHNLALFEAMIAAGCPVDYRDPKGMTPIFLCVKCNFAAGYRHLINAGVLVHWDNDEPRSYHDPIHKSDIDRSFFQAIKEHGRIYPQINHIYLSVAYHNYEVLQVVDSIFPEQTKVVLSTQFRIVEGLDTKMNVTFWNRHWRTQEGRNHSPESERKFSLVSLEILRQDPSYRFIEFFLSRGYQVTKEDWEVLDYKLHPTDKVIFGSIMGTDADRADLPKIHALFSNAYNNNNKKQKLNNNNNDK